MGLLLWLLIVPVVLFMPHHSKALGFSISTDGLSLLSFKNSVTSDPSNLLANWDNQSSTSPCHWYGVTCYNQFGGRVGALKITGVLVGTLTPSIGDLSELRSLSIPDCMFSGEIPKSIGKLRNLEVLELQGNNFSGRIPAQISHFQNLGLLNLSYNAFSGPIPNKLIGSGDFRYVDLSNNQLSGPIVVDSSSKCDLLGNLKLSHNFLTGEIPSEIGECRNLRTLLLDGNIFEGRIPPEIGQISELRILDVSRNSLTGRIPNELANCRNLSVLVLTDLVDDANSGEESWLGSSRGEFNAFDGGIPHEVLLLQSLKILWAPRANLGGRFPRGWSDLCSLRVLNLGQNYITGVIPESIGSCRNLTFLDLSSNNLVGYLPMQHLRVECMLYFNVSRNNISGVLLGFRRESCEASSIPVGQDPNFLARTDVMYSYCNIPVWHSHRNTLAGSGLEETIVISHDFSWNSFMGTLPLFWLGVELFNTNRDVSYILLLNNNKFNGTLPYGLVSNCNDLTSVSVNLSVNQLTSWNSQGLLLDCVRLTEFDAAHNQIVGSIGPAIGDRMLLQHLDLSTNKLSGSLPVQLEKLKNLKKMLLRENNLTGGIPSQLGKLTSLFLLDLSHNALTGTIPASMTNVSSLEIMLLDHNKLSGEIPSSFSALSALSILDVSFNNLSGHIPHLPHQIDCNSFRGNEYLHSCPDGYSAPPAYLPMPLEVQKWNKRKFNSLIIAVVTSASVVFCVLLVIVLVFIFRRSKFGRVTSLRTKVVVTFADAPAELNYDNLVRATGNFSIRNLIGTGGFGSTYKAELTPGFHVAVKRLSIGRFQGIQQFDAEIRTLGRIRHKNLVTLIGYYVGEAEMILIYNYLSGGNLEAFIHDKSGKNVQWSIIHKIAMDIAQALTYLHYSCSPRIVHRDIKPSNILLDQNLNAYLSDFGLARLLEVSETHATTDVAGTFGYVAPEYATTCRVSDKADVYSFGVVLLELMSGRKSLDPSFSEYGNGFNIVPWAKLLIREGRSSELFSPVLWEAGPKENLLGLIRLALTCTVESLSIRPSMKQVLEKLKQLKD
ncbi:LRR receptor-like kinase family protein [Quillaja saponaria]|uniref:non-specific serine/threonine protein kinase n=1 Tax=Quillaja saponaria TaxID=32244 RepID=A0AAD7Q7P5_QUISA|nr:LRR receptor-like kinase family protein [Quillaja saponaria]KAJ7976307.1 LRR receptor-like kinase family protein [Quillaja saponaria]